MTVYFIKPVGMDGPIKVGTSRSPDCRLQTLDSWSPFALEVVAEVDGGVHIERRFHALFAETHQRREWFGWSRRIAATIAAINAGTFDVDTLPEPISVARLAWGKPKIGPKYDWTPERRFGAAYYARANCLHARGMPRELIYAGPTYDFLHHSPTAAEIGAVEDYINGLTEKYGHAGLKPVRWHGPLPEAAQRIGIAA